MANVKKCDLCKAYYDDEKFLNIRVKHNRDIVNIAIVITKGSGEFVDLCKDCLAKEVSMHFNL